MYNYHSEFKLEVLIEKFSTPLSIHSVTVEWTILNSLAALRAGAIMLNRYWMRKKAFRNAGRHIVIGLIGWGWRGVFCYEDAHRLLIKCQILK